MKKERAVINQPEQYATKTPKASSQLCERVGSLLPAACCCQAWCVALNGLGILFSFSFLFFVILCGGGLRARSIVAWPTNTRAEVQSLPQFHGAECQHQRIGGQHQERKDSWLSSQSMDTCLKGPKYKIKLDAYVASQIAAKVTL